MNLYQCETDQGGFFVLASSFSRAEEEIKKLNRPEVYFQINLLSMKLLAKEMSYTNKDLPELCEENNYLIIESDYNRIKINKGDKK